MSAASNAGEFYLRRIEHMYTFGQIKQAKANAATIKQKPNAETFYKRQ